MVNKDEEIVIKIEKWFEERIKDILPFAEGMTSKLLIKILTNVAWKNRWIILKDDKYWYTLKDFTNTN